MAKGKRKIYVVLIALAVGALLLDRMTGTTPGQAGAESQFSTGTNPPAEAGDVQEVQRGNDEWVLFPENLPDFDEMGLVRDPFLLPLALRATTGSQVSSPKLLTSTRKPGEPLTVQQFKAMYHLRGVMVSDTPVAIFDSRMVELGEKLDCSTFLRFEGGKAYFQCSDGIAELTAETER